MQRIQLRKLEVSFDPARCARLPRGLLPAGGVGRAAPRPRAPWRRTPELLERRRVFREELDDFLPDRVLDFHVHVMGARVMPGGALYSCAGHPLRKYDLRDLDADLKAAYPGRRTFAVVFGMPHPDYDMARNNREVAAGCDRKRFFPFRLFDPDESNHEAVRGEIIRSGFLGLKPYLDYVRKPDRNLVQIREMLPDWIMEIAHDLGLIVMLHIPRKDRLSDPLNQKQIAGLCCRYPCAKIVLAHVGRAYYLRNIVGRLDRLKGLPNLWYDLAMLNNWEVLEYLFRTVPADRILYATDIPIALAPGKSVEINHQYTYVTPVPWELSVADTAGRIAFSSFLYEEIRAIRKAVERLGLGRRFVEGLFCDNGMRLLRPATSAR